MWSNRHPAIATGAVAGFLVLMVLAVGLWARHYTERRRLDDLRVGVAALLAEGRGALDRGEANIARERFQRALSLAQSEPGLADHLTGILGWLDHSHRGADERIRLSRNAPPLFDERRDEATLMCFLADPDQPRSIDEARTVIADVRGFIPHPDPAWRGELEWLARLDASVCLQDNDGAKALAALATISTPTRVAGRLRVEAFEKLGRPMDAETERDKISLLAGNPVDDALFAGLQSAHHQNFKAANEHFDRALAIEPSYHIARLLQGASLVACQRPDEARIALTAYIGERARSPWGYLFRARASLQKSDLVAAAQDLQAAWEKFNGIPNHEFARALNEFGGAFAKLSEGQRDGLMKSMVLSQAGSRPIDTLESLLPIFNTRK